MQIVQDKFSCFCLELTPRGHINSLHFWKTNWLPVERRAELCTSTTVFKYWKEIAQSYVNNYNTRSHMALDIRLCRGNKGQKSMSFIGPKIWNKVSSVIKTAVTTSFFANHLKKEILSKLQEWAIFFRSLPSLIQKYTFLQLCFYFI